MSDSGTRLDGESYRECGFQFDRVTDRQLGADLREVTSRYERRLAERNGSELRHHPGTTVWSALEYACHVRDVLFNLRDRALLALVEENPTFAPIHREERVELARYADEDSDRVADAISIGGSLLALLFEGLSREQLARTGVYGGIQRDVRWIGRQALHEATHHLGDIDTCILAASVAHNPDSSGSS